METDLHQYHSNSSSTDHEIRMDSNQIVVLLKANTVKGIRFMC